MTYIKIGNYLPSSELTRECEIEKKKYNLTGLAEQQLIEQEQAQFNLEQVFLFIIKVTWTRLHFLVFGKP